MAQAGNRSLKAALTEAGFGDRYSDGAPSGMSAASRELAARMRAAAPEPRKSRPTNPRTSDPQSREPSAGEHEAWEHEPDDHDLADRERSGGAIVSGPSHASLALFKDLNRKPALVEPQGVVSPPPWMRAARRGRRHARMMNTFGWVMTLVVAGAIVGVTGRYLAVPHNLLGVPGALEAMQARP